MKHNHTKIIMGMPITVEIVDDLKSDVFKEVFDYFRYIDHKYSTYKSTSEISKINKGLDREHWSAEMKKVLDLCEQTKRLTNGYFNVSQNGKIDPSGLVKGWAINNAANILRRKKLKNFYIEAGGDIQVSGHHKDGNKWLVGIRNPFDVNHIVKVLRVSDEGVATSGLYIRGDHIYNPLSPKDKPEKVQSLTVIAKNIFEADRFATAAFAMDTKGIAFIESVPGLEAYMINNEGIATFTSGFSKYVVKNA